MTKRKIKREVLKRGDDSKCKKSGTPPTSMSMEISATPGTLKSKGSARRLISMDRLDALNR
ncbi:MAG: hypothetical protein GY859_21135 [Desulfobacterales bacterium]|nr:hypothetical protein [Desulfobacterales bacterium]